VATFYINSATSHLVWFLIV